MFPPCFLPFLPHSPRSLTPPVLSNLRLSHVNGSTLAPCHSQYIKHLGHIFPHLQIYKLYLYIIKKIGLPSIGEGVMSCLFKRFSPNFHIMLIQCTTTTERSTTHHSTRIHMRAIKHLTSQHKCPYLRN